MKFGGSKAELNKNNEIGEITRILKSIARDLNCPVLALSQLSRALEVRTSQKPILSDLRDSGNIEQDADVVMFLFRPDYYAWELKVQADALKSES